MEGYKKEVVPFKDRWFIFDRIKADAKLVPQSSLDPYKNIKNYGCNALASGDGFEGVELNAIEKLNLHRIDIKLPKEKTKKYSSNVIITSHEHISDQTGH